MKLKSVLVFAVGGLIAVACGGESSLGDGGGPLGQGGSSGYDPCAGQPCGSTCSTCDPADTNCNETAVLKYCSAGGDCTLNFPVCPGPSKCTTDQDCTQPDAPCQQCPDGSTACPNAQCLNGECVSSFGGCSGTICKMDSDCPQIGAPCQKCPDGSLACPESKCVNGQCAGGFPGCGGYDPCAGKKCGEQCSQCNPADPGCAETAVLKYCDESGACGSAFPVCGGGGTCSSKLDCPGVGACPPCPGGGCAELDCVNGACQFVCQPNPQPQCRSADECIPPPFCRYCADGSCAKGDCVNGQCRLVCPPVAPQCTSDLDCPKIEICKNCPDGSCAVVACVVGSCELVCGL